ncbi:transcriptional regulator [Streptomyces sp. M10(2022)]
MFGAWRQWAWPRLSGSRRLLSCLLPPRGYSPDFLTPTYGDRRTLQAAVDTLMSTPPQRLRADLTQLASSLQLPSWVGSLAGGDAESLRRLGGAVQTYQTEALAPYWQRVHAHIDADRAVRLRSLLEGGIEGLLAGLGPQVRWRPPVLEVTYPVDQQLLLRGRGLVLQPSFFCWPTPITLADGELPPVLVYPIDHASEWAGPAPGVHKEGPQPWGRCSGTHVRASCVRPVSAAPPSRPPASSTSPTRSQPARERAARGGLVITVRKGGRSFHVATAEGRALLATEER